jgi:hypothetical protein
MGSAGPLSKSDTHVLWQAVEARRIESVLADSRNLAVQHRGDTQQRAEGMAVRHGPRICAALLRFLDPAYAAAGATTHMQHEI